VNKISIKKAFLEYVIVDSKKTKRFVHKNTSGGSGKHLFVSTLKWIVTSGSERKTAKKFLKETTLGRPHSPIFLRK
jgi:hypothetical protein